MWGGGGASGMLGEGPTQGLWGQGTREARTPNMLRMSVTLEVSKLSGWLNALACCRVEGRGTCDAGEARAGRREGVGRRRRKRHARGGPTQGLEARARAERTSNMLPMFVT